jgi:type I restriction enzyme S subunit
MIRPKAFIILFKDLHVWSVGSFFSFNWQWPAEHIKPLSAALKRKTHMIDKADFISGDLKLVTLHFDGSMAPRASNGKNDFKGNLYLALAGDVVYSKIDVRNGAIGIVPEDLARVAVSSEFPVYEVDSDVALPRYIKLLFRTQYFRRAINSMISGTSGRKRVQPSQIESIEIPLPPLPIQQAIVEKWQTAQREIKTAKKKVQFLNEQIDRDFLFDLGLKINSNILNKKVFSVWWNQLSRWDVTFAQHLGRNIHSTKYENVKISDVIKPLKDTVRRTNPNSNPKENINYIGLANVEALTGRLVNFTPMLGETIESSCVVFDEEHILYGKLRPYLRKTVYPNEFGVSHGVASSEFLPIKPRENILGKFLAQYLRSLSIEIQARQAIGARMPRISSEALLGFSIPLPSLEIQNQIIDKIEMTKMQIDDARRAAEKKSVEIKAEIEALILGIKKIEVQQ